MKQNPSQAKRILLVVVTLVLLPVGCVKRTREPLIQSSRADTATIDVRRININSASASELEALPGIGRAIAERIVAHRSQHGPFRRVEHVMLVRGISERKFLDIQPLITVE
ncbi:MAG TPA: helix-hairpin-helix domain-containing protein [Pyrinomonadaceae bacterium]|nr:helix-hairpin-helix domain-containing protein [Pyrinomonadaceae bacterium]